MVAIPTSAAVEPVELAFPGAPHRTAPRDIPIEMPVQVVFGGMPFAVMMMTPADLEDFAYGFSLTEGVIETAADIRGVAIVPVAGGIALTVDLVPARLQAHLARRRAMTGRTSCGLCGIEDFASLPRARQAPGAPPALSLAAVRRVLAALDEHQPLNERTRAVHGAAFADAGGNILAAREDVGRHNALDKLIGACLRADLAAGDGFVLITSRASYEMIEKTCAFGCRALVAISAPTALAVERARNLDLTLLAIARQDGVTVFHGADRVTIDEATL